MRSQKSLRIVRETAKGLAFPSNIARERDCLDKIAIAFVAFVSLLWASVLQPGDKILYLVNAVPFMFAMLGFVEIIMRICYVLEERKHLLSRYNNQVALLLCDVFHWYCITVAIVASLILTIIGLATKQDPLHVVLRDYPSVIFIIISMLLLRRIIKLEQSPLNTALQFNELQGCDYGSGMAHSFYNGYLRIVLRNSGLQHDKNLREFQQDYESSHNIKFDVYKLFILIPLSQYCPPKLENEFSPSVEVCEELESKALNRAGVKGRSYKNTVYKIRTVTGGKKYVTAEYATPVMTLRELMMQNTPFGMMYKRHCKEILLNFYMTLRHLIRIDEECRDLCEIIYYDDIDDNGDLKDVGEVILSRLRSITKKND